MKRLNHQTPSLRKSGYISCFQLLNMRIWGMHCELHTTPHTSNCFMLWDLLGWHQWLPTFWCLLNTSILVYLQRSIGPSPWEMDHMIRAIVDAIGVVTDHVIGWSKVVHGPQITVDLRRVHSIVTRFKNPPETNLHVVLLIRTMRSDYTLTNSTQCVQYTIFHPKLIFLDVTLD